MPPQRKYRPRRRVVRRRRAPTAYRGKRMPMYKSIPGASHVFKRLGLPVEIRNQGTLPPTISTGGLGFQIGTAVAGNVLNTCDFGIGANFRLQDTLQFNEFQTLYDRYKIVGVKLKFLYQYATAQDQQNWNTGSPPVVPLPIIDFAYDADDSTVPATRTEVQQKGYCKTRILTANSPWKTYYRPRIDKSVFNNSVVSAYTSEKACWLDCKNPDVEHYGFKAWISSWPFDPAIFPAQQFHAGLLTIQPVYYLAMKGTQ